MKMELPGLRWICAAATCCILPSTALADIYQWEYAVLGNPASGKRASSIIVASGVVAAPGASLRMPLQMAYLDGYDLQYSDFLNSNITNATLAGANLSGADFRSTTMTGADLTNADIRGTTFYNVTSRGLTPAQIYSTKSYFDGDLANVALLTNDLSGWNFAAKSLIGAQFVQSNLAGADFTGADVRFADFRYGGSPTVIPIAEAQLVSTASYQAGDLTGIRLAYCNLTGWNFTGQNLAGADFTNATLTGAQFTGANIQGTYFGTSFTVAQLQSTVNYAAGDLRGVRLQGLNLTGANFAGMNLSGMRFDQSVLTNAVFTGASIRGASFYVTGLTESQLASTADYQDGNLEGVNLIGKDMSGWNFGGINLTNVRMDSTRLTGTNFTGAVIKNANFDFSFKLFGFSADQLYSTASYQQGDLGHIHLRYYDISGWDLSNQYMEGAEFSFTDLSGTNFTGAIIRGASFIRTTTHPDYPLFDFQASQLYSTASYQQHDLRGIDLRYNNLTGWNFAGQDLSGAWFGESNLTDCDFQGALIAGADFSITSLTASQMYSTTSYARGDFRGVTFTGSSLAGRQFVGMDFSGGTFQSTNFSNANLEGANLSNAYLISATFAGANLRGADARGSFALVLPASAVTDNLINSNGEIFGFHLAGGRLVVRDYDGKQFGDFGDFLEDGYEQVSLPAIAIKVREHFVIDAASTLELRFEADDWDSTISFDADIPVTLGGTLELNFVDGVNLASQVGKTFDLFDWTGVSPSGVFDISSKFLWDLSRLYTTGEVIFLSTTSRLPGDYNADGSVDAADYTLWRDSFGQQVTIGQLADGDRSGLIDEGDYIVWKQHFGQSTGMGSGALSGVPEPSSAVLAMLIFGLMAMQRRQR